MQHHHSVPQLFSYLGIICLNDPLPLLFLKGHTSLGAFLDALASSIIDLVVKVGLETSNIDLGIPCLHHCFPVLL